jgi:hypothetical protein
VGIRWKETKYQKPAVLPKKMLNELSSALTGLWSNPYDRLQITACLEELNSRYALFRKMEKESGVDDIIRQMFGRLAAAYPELRQLRKQRVLDIACGSNSSKLPGSLYVNTPFGEVSLGKTNKGYTSLFEPWFCRILLALEADPIGIDFGDLDGEMFEHYHVDLGKPGALDFLPSDSFDGIQDSRLFGSPEFTAQFPRKADRYAIAREIRRQEERLLKPTGIIIHSDAKNLVGD